MWQTNRITVKPYAAMGLLHAAIDAALRLRTEVSVSEIDRIDIDMPEAAYGHGGWRAERPLEAIGAQMNVAYTVAVALLDGQVLVDQFSADRINGDDVWNLIDRTETHHQSAYDQLPVDERLTTQVRITLTGGSIRRATVAHPRGNGDHAFTNPEIREKYRKLTNSAISADRQAAIEHAILDLESIDEVSELMALLTPTVHSPLD